jgi:hypothetical protein
MSGKLNQTANTFFLSCSHWFTLALKRLFLTAEMVKMLNNRYLLDHVYLFCVEPALVSNMN